MTDYDFRGLSPIDFEALVRDLLQAELGVPFTTFAVGPDGGVDCRHTGDDGVIVAQCKHRPDASRAAMVTSAARERERFDSTGSGANENPPSSYYFVTSATLSPSAVDAISDALGPLVPHSGFVWGRGRLNGALAAHPRLERRHFKLWMNSIEVFNRIVGSGEWERNESFVRSIQEHVQVWVQTPKYGEAADTLRQNRVVIISGAPGVGKSTLAEMLLLTHWEAGFKVVKLTTNIADAWKHLRNESDEKVIFYYDDFLGQTSPLELQKNESSDLGQLIRALQRSPSGNALLVMTTREQILNAALHSGDDRIARALDGQDRILVELATITRNGRAQMLVNHLYFSYRGSGLLREFATDRRYRKIIDHPAFNPRILESVVLLRAPRSVSALYAELLNALDHPDTIWLRSFRQLPSLASRIVLTLAADPSRSVPVTELERIVSEQDDAREFIPALRILDDTWTRIETVDGVQHVRLYDPSRRDFLLEQLTSRPLFDETLRYTFRLQQIDFLLGHRSLHERQVRRAADNPLVGQRAVHLLAAALGAAVAAEDRRLHQGDDRRWRIEPYRERVSALIAAVNVLAHIPNNAAFERDVIAALSFLDGEFDSFSGPTASDAFVLALALDDLDLDWAEWRAESAVVIGVHAIQQVEEFREYLHLGWDLHRRVASAEVTAALDNALHAQLANVPSLPRPSAMIDEIEELEFLANELDVMLMTDGMRDYVESLEEPPASDASAGVQRLVGVYDGADSDSAIASLFEALRTGDDYSD